MALRIPLTQAIERIGHQKGVRNHELVRAMGDRSAHSRFKRPPVQEPCLIRVKGPARRHHVVLFEGGKVYDPAYELPAPTLQAWTDWLTQIGWKVVSYLPLRPLFDTDASNF